MSSIYHISDLHVRSKSGANEVVRAKLAGIRKLFGPGDVLVVTGDITDDGHASQYALALELLIPFKGSVAVVPGNHDFGPWGNLFAKECVRRFAKFRVELGCDVPLMLHAGGNPSPCGEVIVLDSNLRTASPLDLAQGKVGWFQLKKLQYQLWNMNRAGAISIVALHHSPYEQSFALRLQDSDAFLRTVLGHADYVLMGHEHRQFNTVFPPSRSNASPTTQLFGAGALCKANTQVQIIPITPKVKR